MIPFLIALIWYAVGVWSHIYWMRAEDDFLASDIPLTLVAGICGPIIFLIGLIVLGGRSRSSPKVLLRRRHHD